MLELIVNFAIGLTIVGVPSFVFYKLGMDTGIERGERRQILKDLMVHGIIEEAENPNEGKPVLPTRLFARK